MNDDQETLALERQLRPVEAEELPEVQGGGIGTSPGPRGLDLFTVKTQLAANPLQKEALIGNRCETFLAQHSESR